MENLTNEFMDSINKNPEEIISDEEAEKRALDLIKDQGLSDELIEELSFGKGSEEEEKEFEINHPQTRALTRASYSDSPLVDVKIISPNCNSPRINNIDTITIHMVVGQCSVETLGGIFLPVSRQASSNYGVGVDGRIGLYCHERDRSWCSSSPANDHRAITIETASDTFYPYRVNDVAYKSLIKLCADICKRNGKKKMVWCGSLWATNNRKFASDEMRMTLHKWFADTACPGYYLESHMSDIANQVNKILKSGSSDDKKEYPKTPFYATVNISDLQYRKGAGTNFKSYGNIPKGKYTITKVNGDWGYVKEKSAWIYIGNDEWVTLSKSDSKPDVFKPYIVRITANILNIRDGAGTNYRVNGTIRDRGKYTIVAESNGPGASKWGKLKSGVGWISLDFTEKV